MAPWRRKRDIVVVILAGGQGERLSILSAQRAKPAVPFGGKYRIIDFALSNTVNSGLYDVLVLTQYRPVSLHDHLGTGKPWDLDRSQSIGIRLISPYLGRRGADWYRGTADAVYQNIAELIELGSEHVVMLGGDHVYMMDYRPMIERHVRSKADLTVGLQRVPIDETHRFGIAETDKGGRIVEWHEKPKKPVGDLASLGFYVFRTEKLLERLVEDAERGNASKHDFGGDVVPRMIAEGDRVIGHRFDGYWRDVGTIQSYWESHMELLAEQPPIDLYDRGWQIHTKSEQRSAGYVGPRAAVSQSLISHGCRVFGHLERSVLSPGVVVEEGAIVRDSIVMFDCVIGAGAVLDHVIADKEVDVGAGAMIGFGDDTVNELEPQRLNTGITLLGKRAVVPAGTQIGRNCRIDPGVQALDYSGVEVASGKTVLHSLPER